MAHSTIVRILPAVLFAFIGGCGTGQPAASESGRPQRMVTSDLTGIWISPPSDTVNDWQVALLPDESMTVSGPGLRARGSYRVSKGGIDVNYSNRNGVIPGGKDRQARLYVDPTTDTLIFPTGIVGDAEIPVRLVRATELNRKFR